MHSPSWWILNTQMLPLPSSKAEHNRRLVPPTRTLTPQCLTHSSLAPAERSCKWSGAISVTLPSLESHFGPRKCKGMNVVKWNNFSVCFRKEVRHRGSKWRLWGQVGKGRSQKACEIGLDLRAMDRQCSVLLWRVTCPDGMGSLERSLCEGQEAC